MLAPQIILTRPQMGENIGAAARAMANFGLSQMNIINPRDGWPNVKAADMAGKALPILDDAVITNTAQEAVADCHVVFATTARDRTMKLPAVDAREAMTQALSASQQGKQVGVLFGPERTGLENDEVILADKVITIPVSETYPSLNLAQAVALVAYEWQMAVQHDGGVEKVGTGELPDPADKQALQGLFDQLEIALDASDFFKVSEKKPIIWRNIQASLTRAGLSDQEVRTWRGIIRALSSL